MAIDVDYYPPIDAAEDEEVYGWSRQSRRFYHRMVPYKKTTGWWVRKCDPVGSRQWTVHRGEIPIRLKPCPRCWPNLPRETPR